MSSVMLLSAGLDSTVNFKCALDNGPVLLALTFDYGQRAARREIGAAAEMCARYRVPHEVIRLPWLADITTTALVARAKSLPRPDETDLDDKQFTTASASKVWVPNRNGVFLAVAAAFAESLGAKQIVAGFNAEEAATFPDNSSEFLHAANNAFAFSTLSKVRAVSYTSRLRKVAIVRLGIRISAPLDLTWCCYEGGRKLCGRCESCRRFVRAVRRAGKWDWFREHHPGLPREEKQ